MPQKKLKKLETGLGLEFSFRCDLAVYFWQGFPSLLVIRNRVLVELDHLLCFEVPVNCSWA